jgi:hypothetical protein
MAKIGTMHVEVKPVLNEQALAEISDRIEKAVADGVARGLAQAQRAREIVYAPPSPRFNPAPNVGTTYNPGQITC